MPAELSWSGWGDPTQASELPEAVGELLRTGLGVTRATPAPRAIEELALVAPRLPAPVVERLGAAVGPANARGDHASRARHALGRSTLDLLALRSGAPSPPPTPRSRPQATIRCWRYSDCSQARVAVVPFGGGTSVVGGLTPDADGFAGWVALDLTRLDAVHDVDTESRLARLGPGLRGPDAEARLGAHGYTIGELLSRVLPRCGSPPVRPTPPGGSVPGSQTTPLTTLGSNTAWRMPSNAPQAEK